MVPCWIIFYFEAGFLERLEYAAFIKAYEDQHPTIEDITDRSSRNRVKIEWSKQLRTRFPYVGYRSYRKDVRKRGISNGQIYQIFFQPDILGRRRRKALGIVKSAI